MSEPTTVAFAWGSFVACPNCGQEHPRPVCNEPITLLCGPTCGCGKQFTVNPTPGVTISGNVIIDARAASPKDEGLLELLIEAAVALYRETGTAETWAFIERIREVVGVEALERALASGDALTEGERT